MARELSLAGVNTRTLRRSLVAAGWNDGVVSLFAGPTLNVGDLIDAVSLASDGDLPDIALIVEAHNRMIEGNGPECAEIVAELIHVYVDRSGL